MLRFTVPAATACAVTICSPASLKSPSTFQSNQALRKPEPFWMLTGTTVVWPIGSSGVNVTPSSSSVLLTSSPVAVGLLRSEASASTVAPRRMPVTVCVGLP